MTAATDRISGRLTVPLTQNTAPVFEFNCLYSQDVRRKHKRWKDGFLKYHTFNKRVLVYDVPRNFIGDMHWLGQEELQEGDELKLEKSGTLVQVAEKVGQTETDLTELRNSKNRRTECVGASSPSRPYSTLGQSVTATATATVGRQRPALKNKPLNALLGTPRGPIGKAILPTKSPFESRHESESGELWTEGRPAKRPRVSKAPAQTPVHHLSGADPTSTRDTIPQRPGSISAAQQRGRHFSNVLRQDMIIDLCDEEPETMFTMPSPDNFELPSSPLNQTLQPHTAVETSSSPYFQTQKHPFLGSDPRQPSESNTSKLQQLENTNAKRISPKQRSNSKPTSGECQDEDRHGPVKDLPNQTPAHHSTAKRNPGKILRLAASKPKKKALLCQEQINIGSKAVSLRADHYTERSQDGDDTATRSVGESLAERLKRIDKKNGSTSRLTLGAPGPADVIPDDNVIQGDEDIDSPDVGFDNGVQVSKEEAEPVEDLIVDQCNVGGSSPPSPKECRTESAPPPSRTDHDRSRLAESRLESPSHAEDPDDQVDVMPSDNVPPADTGVVMPAEPMDLDSPDAKPESSFPENAKEHGFQPASVLDSKTAHRNFKPFKTPGVPVKPGPSETIPGSGPWSREAFDLFTWRPPKWDEEKWCVKG